MSALDHFRRAFLAYEELRDKLEDAPLEDEELIDKLANESRDALRRMVDVPTASAGDIAIKLDELLKRYKDFNEIGQDYLEPILRDAKAASDQIDERTADIDVMLQAASAALEDVDIELMKAVGLNEGARQHMQQRAALASNLIGMAKAQLRMVEG